MRIFRAYPQLVREAGVVRNISVTNAYSTGSGITTGLLAGLNRGLITYATSSGSADAETVGLAAGLVGENQGDILRSSSSAGAYSTGGSASLAGANSGLIVQSFASGGSGGAYRSVSGGLVLNNSGTITQSYFTGDTASTEVGGIAAFNSGAISESFVAGRVFNISFVSPYKDEMGAIAESNTGTIASNVFWDVQVSGNRSGVYSGTPVSAANGLSTAQMGKVSSFGPTWDFSKGGVWVMPSDGTHPILRWQAEANTL
jgi:hypothetical protein